LVLCLAVGITATAGAGCFNAAATRPELSHATLIIDPAMQKRDWDQSVAYYPGGAVPAWNTRFWYTPSPNEPPAIKPISEPIEFIGQSLFVPITLITARPFTPVIYRGVQEPSTSNAFPAPPPDTLSTSQGKQTSRSSNTGTPGGAAGGH
jgi:hypothetical protein